MRHRLFALVLLSLTLPGAAPALADGGERTVTLPLPPASLEQWYKPANERQVWLHTMFRLRRSMQAIIQYSAIDDARPQLIKWTEQLLKDYHSIGDMVPEWRDELETEWAQRLLDAARKGDRPLLERAVRKLRNSCSGCHKEYRAITAALYRTPDFSGIVVEDQETLEEMSYEDTMTGLSTSLNRIVIGLADQDLRAATLAQEQLVLRLDNLAGSCAACHKDESAREQLLGEASRDSLATLGKQIAAGDIKQSQHTTGKIAVRICARCHAVHRTLYDLRGFIVKSE